MASGQIVDKFEPTAASPPDSSAAKPDKRNARDVLDFEENDIAYFGGVLPTDYDDSGTTIEIWFSMSSAVSGNVAWEWAWERYTEDDLDTDSDDFASAQSSGDVAVSTTSGKMQVATINCDKDSEMDYTTGGDPYRGRLKRVAPSGSSASGDAEVHKVIIREQ